MSALQDLACHAPTATGRPGQAWRVWSGKTHDDDAYERKWFCSQMRGLDRLKELLPLL